MTTKTNTEVFLTDAQLCVVVAKAIEEHTGQKLLVTRWNPANNLATKEAGICFTCEPRSIELYYPNSN